jgi:acyl carrier protein
MNKEQLKEEVRQYVKLHVLNNQAGEDFTDDTPLISTRLMDSILTLKMINHFEDLLKVECKAHEVTADNLDSINIFTDFLFRKMTK